MFCCLDIICKFFISLHYFVKMLNTEITAITLVIVDSCKAQKHWVLR